MPSSQRTIQRWFNTDAFAAFSPAPQAFGNAGVGIMRGPGYANFDFTIAKDFRINDGRRFQFRTEIFNAFNRVNLRTAEHPARIERLRANPERRQRAHRAVRTEVLLLTAARLDVARFLKGRRLMAERSAGMRLRRLWVGVILGVAAGLAIDARTQESLAVGTQRRSTTRAA